MGSPAFAPPDVKDVTLSLFAGPKLDVAPSDLPEGLTPDTGDGIYLPGTWQSRPGLSLLFNPPLPNGVSVVYEKTYVQPNDEPITLVIDSNGILWAEDVDNNPGVATQIGNITGGLYAQSITAFGREYIAPSDLLHGQGVPLQFDGTNLDRVTQDGPGAGPAPANIQPPFASINHPGSGVSTSITTANRGFGGFITFNVASSAGFVVGLYAQATGVSDPTFDVLARITGVGTGFVTVFQSNPAPGSTTGGTLALVSSTTSISRNSNVATANTTAPHGFQPGWQVQISGEANTNIGAGIVSVQRDGNGVVTVYTAAPHGLPVGATIAIVGVTNPDGSFNTPGVVVASVPSPTSFTFQQGGSVEHSTLGTGNVQDVWNTTAFIQATPTPTTFTYQQLGPDNQTMGTGIATIIGQVSPGNHGIVVMFLTRNGALTKPSPPIQFTANGASQLFLADLPLGPANVVARVIGLTGAGGDNYFILPATPQVAGQIVGTSTVIPDNTSTEWTLDFSDTTLFGGIPIDVVGNDLFDQVVLGPVLGFFSYASRLAAWGDYNKIENFLNMGFCGGVETPLAPDGWTAETPGGILASGVSSASWPSGFSWRITGDGTANPKGRITQGAFQDTFGVAILTGATQYLLRFWAISTTAAFGGGGNIIAEFYSASGGGVLASATISCDDLDEGLPGSFVQAAFNVETPATIPSDTVLRVYAQGLRNSAQVFLGEVEIVYAEAPYRDVLSRWSYALNPEGFAQTTGNLGASDDAAPIRAMALLRQNGMLGTGGGVHDFQDNQSEPYKWVVNSLTRAISVVSLRAFDAGKFGTGDAAEDWLIIAAKNGAYLFAGGEFWKVSQEMSRGALPQSQDPRKTWDDINWAVEQTIVAKNDPAKRRAYFAVPINGSLTPNIVFVMDYREMDTATQIAGAPPLHITIQGKMKSSDLTRKWSPWNVKANDIDILERPGNELNLFFAGGDGQALGTKTGFGNIYSLDPAKLSDDDYGAIAPFYTTYFFTDHDQEQALGIGSDMHLVKRIHAFITGLGLVMIVPIVNSLYNFQPALSPRMLVADTNQSNFLKSDLEWSIAGLRGQRIAFRIFPQPLPGSTDVQIRLQKFIVGMMKDPIAQVRQSII